MVVFYATQDDKQAEDSKEDATMRARVPFFFAISCVVVLVQCLTTAGLMNGVMKNSCESQDQCRDRGTFCHPKMNRCEYCGSDEAVVPPWVTNEDIVWVWEPTKPGFNFTWVVVRIDFHLTLCS